MRARLRPKVSAWLLVPCARRIMKMIRAPKMIRGKKLKKRLAQLPHELGALTAKSTPFGPVVTPSLLSNCSMLALGSLRDFSFWPLFVSTVRESPFTVIFCS